MHPNDLSAEEVALVKSHREERALKLAALVFQRKAIATALSFKDWSAESGEGLTFSTFVNSFGYQDGEGRQMFDAVERILNAALPK